MIRSFRSKALQRFAASGDASRLSVRHHDRVRQILLVLDAAAAPEAMNMPGLRFHPLKGRDRGRVAVWVSGNWRITFAFDGEDAVGLI
jgi:proteic killer suppression protein